MARRLSFILFLPIAALIGRDAGAAISLTDDAGRKVELKQPAQRIVTLAPFLTELVYSAGAGDRLVGVSAYSDYPAEAKRLPQVATATTFSLEEIAALRPDLVLAWRDSVRIEDLRRLEAFGIATFVSQPRRLDEVAGALQSIGRLTSRDVTAAVARYRERLAALGARYSGRPPVTVFVDIWHNPLQTVGGRHWINESLELCGARNAFGELGEIAPVVSWEEVYRRDPAVVVGTSSRDNERTFVANWRARPTLSAVRSGRLVFVDADTLTRPTLRLADGVAQLCAGIDRAR